MAPRAPAVLRSSARFGRRVPRHAPCAIFFHGHLFPHINMIPASSSLPWASSSTRHGIGYFKSPVAPLTGSLYGLAGRPKSELLQRLLLDRRRLHTSLAGRKLGTCVLVPETLSHNVTSGEGPPCPCRSYTTSQGQVKMFRFLVFLSLLASAVGLFSLSRRKLRGRIAQRTMLQLEE